MTHRLRLFSAGRKRARLLRATGVVGIARVARIAICAGLLGISAGEVAAQAQAQTFPSRQVRILVPNAPGSPSDIVDRLLAVKLTEYWNQPVLIDNRLGATGLIAAEAVAKAPPDGHTLFAVSLTQLIATLTFQRFQLATEFAPVAMVGTTPFAIAVSAALPVKNIAEWIAYVKARPGQLMYGSSGQWGSLHLCMEVFNEMAGLKMTHVPHPGTPAVTNAVIGDQIAVFCPAAPSVNTLAQSGKLRALGVTYQKPTRLLPGVPPISDTLPGFELLGWYGMQTTLHTPPEIVSRISLDLARALKLPEIQEKMIATGVDAVGSTPAEFTSFINKESDRWGKVLRDRNAKPEQ